MELRFVKYVTSALLGLIGVVGLVVVFVPGHLGAGVIGITAVLTWA